MIESLKGVELMKKILVPAVIAAIVLVLFLAG